MRIGINARLLLENRLEGIGWHAFEIINRLITAHPDHEFILFYDRKHGIIVPGGKNIKTVVLFPPSRHPILIWWWGKALSSFCRKAELDVFYSPEVLMPLGLCVPVIITIHDLSPIVLPRGLSWSHGNYYRYIIPKFAQEARHIITVSKFSKSEIQNILHLPPEKITVVYNAAREIFRPISNELKQNVRLKFTQGHPYIIYLGSIHARKNVDKMIKAFERFKRDNYTNHYLVLVGKFMGSQNKVKRVIAESSYSNYIVHLGYVSETELTQLVAAGDAMINLSAYEGFGMPLVEAFQAGTPVIASNLSSYPEITQQAAILVSPDDLAQIAEAIKLAMTTSKELSIQGELQAKKFDWSRSADKVWVLIGLLGHQTINFTLSSPKNKV